MSWAGSISYVSFSLGAIVSALAALWIARSGDANRTDRWAGVTALVLTANWCFAAASFRPDHQIVLATVIASNLAWIHLLFRLFANDGRDESMRLVRPAIVSLALLEICQIALLVVANTLSHTSSYLKMLFEISALLRALLSIGGLVMLHNLYVGAAPSSRALLRWNAAALAGMWAFSLNYYTLTYLIGGYPKELTAVSGIAVALVAVAFAIGFNRRAADIRFSPSRAVTFRFFSLLLIGGYLAVMLGLAWSLDMLTGDMARLTQVGLVIAAGVLALIWLPSPRLRGWLRVTAIKHLFKHRYDYRSEWIRFTKTIGRSGVNETSLHERAIKAMADITDSPSGILLVPEDSGAMELAAEWNWGKRDGSAETLSADLAALMESRAFVLDLDRIRLGNDRHGEAPLIPDWLLSQKKAWAVVPLLHFESMVGAIVLARPVVERQLDWEDFDLLGVVGRQLASYLAEQSGQLALSEANRFDEFNRRMAFVLHDIKNLSSQMSLLMRNAERHADKPEFRKDMLVTLRNSADKLNGLLARLGGYSAAGHEEEESDFDLAAITRALADRYARTHPVAMVQSDPVFVRGCPGALEQAVAHLVQNAIDASEADAPVLLEATKEGGVGQITVIDNGTGMSAEFVRRDLFKPFISSKEGGFGIGAFEAREMVRAMGGRLDVESREGLGTRFTVSLPLQRARPLFPRDLSELKSEVA